MMRKALGPYLSMALLVSLASGCSHSTAGPVGDVEAAKQLRAQLASKGGEAAAEEDSGEQRTGWGTLRGAFKISGAPPVLPFLAINTDKEICQPGGKQIPSEALVVGPEGGIANIAIYARQVPDEHVHPEQAAGKTDEVVFDQQQCLFKTHVLAFQASQPVKVINSDNTGHNTNIQGTGFNPIIAANGETFFKAGKEASIPLKTTCNIHPWMVAYMLPRKNSYFAVTKPDGSFEIANLPAGITVEFQVWQEIATNLATVEVEGKPVTWKRGRFTVKLNPDETRQLAVNVPAAVFQ